MSSTSSSVIDAFVKVCAVAIVAFWVLRQCHARMARAQRKRLCDESVHFAHEMHPLVGSFASKHTT